MKTTTDDFKKFIQFCKVEIEAFGLTNWEVNFYHETLDSGLAQTSVISDAKVASISLNTDWKSWPVLEHILQETARHEVIDLLLLPLGRVIPLALGISLNDNDKVLDIRNAVLHEINHRISNRYHPQENKTFENDPDTSGQYREVKL